MLAQNFKTPAELEITDVEHAALVTVLGMLERDEIPHHEYFHMIQGPGFNMGYTLTQSACGTVACLCGWAHVVSNGRAFPWLTERDSGGMTYVETIYRLPYRLFELFRFGRNCKSMSHVTPAEAALALRSFLTTGDAQWNEALRGE